MRVAAIGALAIAVALGLGITHATAHNGPAHTVKVGVIGPGTVVDSLGQINCPGDCTGVYGGINNPNHPGSVSLSASPTGGATFSSWSGCPSPSGASCTITLDASQTSTDVTATFTPAPVATGRDLKVTKVAPEEASRFRSFEYRFSIRNRGPEEARDVVLTDALPAVFFPSESSTGCTVESRILPCGLTSSVGKHDVQTGSRQLQRVGGHDHEHGETDVVDSRPESREQRIDDRYAGRPAARADDRDHIAGGRHTVRERRPRHGQRTHRDAFGTGGVLVAVDSVTIPSPCVGAISTGVDIAARFVDLPVTGLRTGTHVITAWTRDSVGRIASDSIRVTIANEAVGLDVRSLAIEISQGIQEARLSAADGFHDAPGVPSPHLRRRYDGVTLVESKQTAVRLYATADATGGPGDCAASAPCCTAIARGR